MSIDINPETERLLREEIRSGHFRSADEIIVSSVHAWREKHGSAVFPVIPPAAGGAMLQIVTPMRTK